MNWRCLFPFLAWPRPTSAALRKDAWAGLSVGLILIPQSLAYATLAGMPPETGLYAALLPAVFGILWGSSPLLAVGPVALTSLLTFASLQPLASASGPHWVQLAIWLAIYAGILQCLLGAFKLGAITNFVSYPVISGFINAAALIIIFSQLPVLLGLPTQWDAGWLSRAGAGVYGNPERLAASAGFGLGSVLVLVLQKRFAPRLPGILLVCVVGIAISVLIGFEHYPADIVGMVPRGLPSISLPPAMDLAQHRALLPMAIVVALISFTEAMSSCRILSRNSTARWDVDQELIGQGLAKIASGLSGAFPVSGSFSRSALNAYVGATSGWSALFASACIVAFLMWATQLLYYLPRAVLAAVIIVPVVSLLDLGVFRKIFRLSRVDGAVAGLTFVVTLVSVPYLYWGVFAGFAVSLTCYLYRRSRPRVIEVAPHPDGTLRDRQIYGLQPIAPHVLAVRMDAAIAYITAPVLERFVMDRIARAPALTAVLLCLSSANDIDVTGVEMLKQMHVNLGGKGIRLHLSGVKRQVDDVLKRSAWFSELGDGAVFATDREAILLLSDRIAIPA